MSNDFKVGDRVVRYCHDFNEDYRIQKGRVTAFLANGFLQIETKLHETIFAHPKQCRRLIKKSRRRIWVNPLWLNNALVKGYQPSDGVGSPKILAKFDTPGLVEFVEVKRK